MEAKPEYATAGPPPDGIIAQIPNTVSEAELDVLILNLAHTQREHNEDGFTDDDVKVIVDWVHQTRIENVLLEMVLSGWATIDVQSGELIFGTRTSLTDPLKSAILKLSQQKARPACSEAE